MNTRQLIKVAISLALLFVMTSAQAELTCSVAGQQWQTPQADQCEVSGDLPFSSAVFTLANISLENRQIIWSDPQCENNSAQCHLLIEENTQKALCARVMNDGQLYQLACAEATYHRW